MRSLVELIVLNIGLQAGILNAAVFAMFVLMGKLNLVLPPVLSDARTQQLWSPPLLLLRSPCGSTPFGTESR